MAAYGALVSLSKVIDLTLSQEQEYVHPYSREQMMSLHEQIRLLQDLLEHLSGRSHPSIDVLESRIRDASYRLEDIIEYHNYIIQYDVHSHRSWFEKLKSFIMRFLPVAITSYSFCRCAREIGILLEEAMELKEHNLQDKDTSGASHPLTTASSSSEPPTAKLDFNQNEIMDWIFGRSSNLEIIPITGMGGIGKTTLARTVYEHPNMKHHFDICSWVTVSQEYSVNEILRGLLPHEQQNTPDGRLVEFAYKRLIGRKFLIVLDDMWDVKAWDGVMNAFYDDRKGSRIIVTTRLLDVAAYVASSGHVHEMQFLKDEQSWNLLRETVGGNELWSKELEDLGRIISRNCRGLPLAVVTMAGLLKFNMTGEYWKQVASDTKSETVGNDDQFSGILSLSYTNLPHYLKACFLYFGSFKEDYEIPIEELVRLWIAEGFLKPRGSKDMEEVAEEYLEELVARSLVLVSNKRLDGRIKTCIIHDVLWELSLRKAHEEEFYRHIILFSSWLDTYSNNDLRRVTVDPDCFTEDLVYHTHIRSLRLDDYEHVLSLIRHFRLIRVLGNVGITENSQLSVLYQLRNLRYLHIFLLGDDVQPPLAIGESLSNLQNLETLTFSGSWRTHLRDYKLLLPYEIWEMPRLRHLILVEGSKLACLALSEISCCGLQTLTKVTNFDLIWCMTAKLSNLKKLKLLYDKDLTGGLKTFRLYNLVHLHQLEDLVVNCLHSYVKVTDLSFPHKLKKLSLKRTNMPVENMSRIGSLPNLEVLKLKVFSIQGDEWEPIDGEFRQLKYLKMDCLQLMEWRAESEHFPQLDTLIIKECNNLKEVPVGIGEINTLQKLVLVDCRAAEESVKEIKAEQESLSNDLLQVIIRNYSLWFWDKAQY